MTVAQKKIVLLSTGLFEPPGGIRTFNRALAKGISLIVRKQGWRAAVLALNDSPGGHPVERYLDPACVEYRPLNHHRIRFVWSTLREVLPGSLVLLGHVNFLPFAALVRIWRPSAKCAVLVYGKEAWGSLSPGQSLGVLAAPKVISISASTRDIMAERNRLPLSRFELLPPTLDPLYVERPPGQSRADLRLPRGRMILTVSRLDSSEKYKQVDWVIQHLPRVLARVPDAFYVVVGSWSDDSDLERLKTEAARAGVLDKTYFVEQVPDEALSSFYEACDLFLLPSLKEGFGIAFLEAMHHGKPCVGARAGGIPEVIDHGKSGFLVNPDRPDELVETLVSLLTNQELRVEIGRAGKERLEDDFSFERFCERLERILIGLQSGTPG